MTQPNGFRPTPSGPPPTAPEAPPTTAGSWPVLLVVGVGTLLSALAGSAVTLALPALGRDLGLSIQSSRWVVQSFLLVVTVLLLVAGRVGDLLTHRRVYLGGFVLFGAMSLWCGLARSFPELIVARVLQGVGGAMVMATGPALLTTSVPGNQRGRALGMVATATYLGLTVGPPLGGLIIGTLGWRWVFLLNVPVTLFMVAVGPRLLPRTSAPRRTPFDWWGTLALVLGLPPLLLAVTEGHRWGWTTWPVSLSLTLGLVGVVCFVALERRRVAPLIDLGLFRSLTFSAAVLCALANYIALFVPIILMPFFLIEGLGRDAAGAGLLLTAQPVAMAIVASPSGWLSDRIGTRLLATAGMLVMAGGLVGLSTLGLDSSAANIVGWLALLGLGTGLFISPNSNALMGAAPRTQQGVAGGVLAVSRNLGMMLGVTAATVIYHVAGGQTGHGWASGDVHAMRWALRAAAAVALVGALPALLGGRNAPRR